MPNSCNLKCCCIHLRRDVKNQITMERQINRRCNLRCLSASKTSLRLTVSDELKRQTSAALGKRRASNDILMEAWRAFRHSAGCGIQFCFEGTAVRSFRRITGRDFRQWLRDQVIHPVQTPGNRCSFFV